MIPYNRKEQLSEMSNQNNMSNKQLYDNNEKKIGRQDDILDDIIDTAYLTGNESKKMNNTLEKQDKMLSELDYKTDKNIDHLQKTNTRLDDLLAKSSNCCLYMIIVVEIAIMVLILTMFK